MWSNVLTLYDGYIGTGMIAGLFLVAIIYLYVAEKNKTIRVLFIYLPVLTLILYFCPLFAKLIYTFADEEIYYRLLWLVPIVPVLAYSAVKIILSCEGKKRILSGLAICGIFILSGKLVYTNPYFKKAENIYHVPETVVKLCDEVRIEGMWVHAVFPSDFIQYVRQYEPTICMPYGREMLVERWKFQNELYDLMEAPTLDTKGIAKGASAEFCIYIVVPDNKPLVGKFEDYSYDLKTNVDGYDIYYNNEIYEAIKASQ